MLYFLFVVAFLLIVVQHVVIQTDKLRGWFNKEPVYKNRQTSMKKTKPILLLYWSTVFGRRVKPNAPLFPLFRVNQGCEQECELTANKSRATKADALIIHARDPRPLPPEKYSHIPFVLHSQENPVFKSAAFMSKLQTRLGFSSYNQ